MFLHESGGNVGQGSSSLLLLIEVVSKLGAGLSGHTPSSCGRVLCPWDKQGTVSSPVGILGQDDIGGKVRGSLTFIFLNRISRPQVCVLALPGDLLSHKHLSF